MIERNSVVADKELVAEMTGNAISALGPKSQFFKSYRTYAIEGWLPDEELPKALDQVRELMLCIGKLCFSYIEEGVKYRPKKILLPYYDNDPQKAEGMSTDNFMLRQFGIHAGRMIARMENLQTLGEGDFKAPVS